MVPLRIKDKWIEWGLPWVDWIVCIMFFILLTTFSTSSSMESLMLLSVVVVVVVVGLKKSRRLSRSTVSIKFCISAKSSSSICTDFCCLKPLPALLIANSCSREGTFWCKNTANSERTLTSSPPPSLPSADHTGKMFSRLHCLWADQGLAETELANSTNSWWQVHMLVRTDQHVDTTCRI